MDIRADKLLHILWSKAVGTVDYYKNEWMELSRLIETAVYENNKLYRFKPQFGSEYDQYSHCILKIVHRHKFLQHLVMLEVQDPDANVTGYVDINKIQQI